MADEEVRLKASLDDDMSAALARIEQRLRSVEDEVEKLGVKARAAGHEGAEGMDEFGESVEDAGRKSDKAKRPIDDVGKSTQTTGKRASDGADGVDKFGKSMQRAGKRSGGFTSIFKLMKFAGLISGAFALAGGLSAIGAGAAIAVGGLAPMSGALVAILPLFAAAKLATLAWKLAATQLEGPLERIKTQFTELGPEIARGGLLSGVDYFATSIEKLAKVSGKGLAGMGGELGMTARHAGDVAKSAPFLAQVSAILDGLRPIVGALSRGVLSLALALINVLQASLPIGLKAAKLFEDIAFFLSEWTAAQLANGKMAAWLDKAWTIFTRTVGVLVDILIGMYNIFRIAGGFAGEFGASIEDLTWKFRVWTESAEGQARITQYFQDSLPALREMGRLLAIVLGGLGSLGANQNVAPLLAQINDQLLPAIGNLVQNLSGQGGLGPAVISAAASLVQLFAGLDFSGLTMFVQGIAKVLEALVWLQQNVPGANIVISSLLFTMLGFKLLGPIWTLVGKGAAAFSWMGAALAGTTQLSIAQKVFAGGARMLALAFVSVGGAVVNYVLPALKAIAMVGIGALRALSTALLTTPIGWVILAIMAIVAVIILLWNKCEWFRDAVKAVWEAIKVAAMAVWDAIKVAVSAVVDAAVAAWNWLKTAWQNTVDFIVMVAMWIWNKAIKPVLDIIVGAFKIYFGIIKFVVQTAIYIIVAIVTLIAIVLKHVWDSVVTVAKWAWGMIAEGALWLWNTIIKPVVDFIVKIFTTAWGHIQLVAQILWNAIAAGAMWLWTTIIQPVVNFITTAFTTAWNLVSMAAQFLWNAIMTGINWLWTTILQPVFNSIQTVGSAVWNTISGAASAVWNTIKDGWNVLWGFLSGIWDKLKSAGTGVWDGIKSAAGAVVDVVKGVWDKIVGAVKGSWNFIANGWNSIPAITVPDWVPLIGGKTFSLPKLPTLWHGGEAPGGAAIVGEHGPEPLVLNGRMVGMVGQNGPEVASIPRGGYVVPNLNTLNALPGLAKTIPSSVARAVAASAPGYGGLTGGGDNAMLAREVRALARAVAERPPPIVASGRDVTTQVREALRQRDRENDLRNRYSYGEA